MDKQWKLVPVEPTETMVINGFESEPDECFTDEDVWEQYQEMSGCQQAAFRAKLCWAAMLSSAPVAPEDEKPVMKLEAEKLLGGHGEYALSFVRSGWLDECRMIGGEFLLYTHPDTGKVARLTAERDALQLRLNAADQRIDELVSAVRSINRGRRHEIFVSGDDEPQYRQRKEWVDWVLSLCDEASASEPCHEIPGTSGMRLNMLANQGE